MSDGVDKNSVLVILVVNVKFVQFSISLYYVTVTKVSTDIYIHS